MNKTCPLFLAIASFLILPQVSKPILAQSAMGLSAIPPRLEITIEPGQVVTKEIKVRNESSSERFITTNVKDFIVADNKGTPIQIEDVDVEENRWAASSWIQVSPSQVRLKPGETKSLMLSVLAPSNATTGGHYAVVLHSPSTETVLGETGSSIIANVGTLVYITIPGDIKQNAKVQTFAAPKFSEFGPINFKTVIANYSDIHVSPKGEIKITDIFGNSTASLKLEDSNVFPYTTREFANTLTKKWLIGRFKAQLLAGYGTAGDTLTATLFFWVIPWRLIVLVIAIIAIVIALITVARHPKTPTSDSQKVEELERELDDLRQKYRDRR